MSDSSRAQLYYVEESAWGVTPAAALKALRYTGESLGQRTETKVSDEIRNDRQVPDIIRTAVRAEGGVNVEMSYGAHDDLIQGGLYGTWNTVATITGTDISTSSTDNSFNAAGPTTFTGKNLIVGQYIRSSGFANPANNGYFEIVSIAAGKLIVRGGAALVTASAGPSCSFKGSAIVNGTTPRSFTLEKQLSDVSEFINFTGMRVGSFGFSMKPGSVLTGSFAFTGKQAAAPGATVGTGAPTAAPTNDVLNSIDNIAVIRENLTSISATEVEFTYGNALRTQPTLGQAAPSGIGAGTIDVTGRIRSYFADRTLFNKYLNNTLSAIAFAVVDAAGNAYAFNFPAAEYTDGDVVVEGKDGDVLVDLKWTARMDATIGKTLIVSKIA